MEGSGVDGLMEGYDSDPGPMVSPASVEGLRSRSPHVILCGIFLVNLRCARY